MGLNELAMKFVSAMTSFSLLIYPCAGWPAHTVEDEAVAQGKVFGEYKGFSKDGAVSVPSESAQSQQKEALKTEAPRAQNSPRPLPKCIVEHRHGEEFNSMSMIENGGACEHLLNTALPFVGAVKWSMKVAREEGTGRHLSPIHFLGAATFATAFTTIGSLFGNLGMAFWDAGHGDFFNKRAWTSKNKVKGYEDSEYLAFEPVNRLHDMANGRTGLKREILEDYLNRGLDINESNCKTGLTALEEAVGWTTLEETVKKAQGSLVKDLLERGADPNRNGGGALVGAVQQENREVLELLLAHGAKLDAKAGNGRGVGQILLSEAARRGNQEIMEILTSRGVQIDEMDAEDRLLKHIVSLDAQGRKEAVESLLARDPALGEILLRGAVSRGNAKIVKLLLDRGVKTDSADKEGLTLGEQLLLEAAKQRDPKIAQTLLTRTGNIRARDAKGNTPVHYAALHLNYQTLKILGENRWEEIGNALKAQNNAGDTPLLAVLKNTGKCSEECPDGFYETLYSLLNNYPASHHITDAMGRTPLDIAKQKKLGYIVRELEQIDGKISRFRRLW